MYTTTSRADESLRSSPRARGGGAIRRSPADHATVLVSHNHYDHCDLPTLRRLARLFNPLVVTPVGNAALLRSAGMGRVEERDWWERVQLPSMEVTVTPAQHFSARGPFDRNRALWGGFVVELDRVRLYFAGDSGYGPFFRDIRQRLGAIDLALLPIGAYEPRWFMKDIHMNPAEAVQAHLDLEATHSLGMHFGTFQLTPEAIDDPVRALDAARRSLGVPEARLRTLEFGASFRLPAPAAERPRNPRHRRTQVSGHRRTHLKGHRRTHQRATEEHRRTQQEKFAYEQTALCCSVLFCVFLRPAASGQQPALRLNSAR